MARWKKVKDLSTEVYIQQYYQIRKDFMHAKEEAAGIRKTTQEVFEKKVRAKLISEDKEFTKTNVKKAMQSILNSNVYETTATRMHKNLTQTLKEEGMTSRLYRMGGKTAFKYTSWTSKRGQKEIGGAEFKTDGYYRIGQVKVTFWTSVDGSKEQYIEFTNLITGQTHL